MSKKTCHLTQILVAFCANYIHPRTSFSFVTNQIQMDLHISILKTNKRHNPKWEAMMILWGGGQEHFPGPWGQTALKWTGETCIVNFVPSYTISQAKLLNVKKIDSIVREILSFPRERGLISYVNALLFHPICKPRKWMQHGCYFF